MPRPHYRFGPFVVDRTRYCVLHGSQLVELTPKLLDLLLHLLDNAGALVTKEQLLDALWPDSNVTDNALTQAVSELRHALGDDPATPQFIKTVARRGYRFIAAVDAIEAPSADVQSTPVPMPPDHARPSVGVMDFVNVTGDADSAWLSVGIAETVAADLRSTGRFRVVDRARVVEAMRQTSGAVERVAERLGISVAVVGSFQRTADRIRITARMVDTRSREALATAKEDGAVDEIFELQDRIVAALCREMGSGSGAVSGGGSRETPSLAAYRAYIEAWLHLETLDIREIPCAIAGFEQAIAIDSHYALAFTGLASAQLAAYEGTRCNTYPDKELLAAAVDHARHAVTLDPGLAEAHATLALVLVSAGTTIEARQAARRAVLLEPTNWRHFFRLEHATWGDERLRAANTTLSLYPDFAFAHFQIAMVHVARGHLREAEIVLRQGAAVQDRQVSRGDRYPGLGLHWLLGLVRFAQDDLEESLHEFALETSRAVPHRLYGREYQMSAAYARGACLLRVGRHGDAIASFARATELSPEHAQSHLGLAVALEATGARDRAKRSGTRLLGLIEALRTSRPIEAQLVEAQLLALRGELEAAAAALTRLLDAAPPGFAGWTIPIEPFLRDLRETTGFVPTLRRLAERAK